MPSKLDQERVMLREAELGGLGSRLGAYVKLSGPGWLQSAITLGGGSLGSSLFLGVLAGYSLLWLQPVAIVLGVIMLCAISHVALSTGQSPFKAINEEINPVLGWGWAIATILANVVWCLPQFSLGTAAATQNLFPLLDNLWGKILVCAVLLGGAIAAILAYDRGAKGAKAFDNILKVMVAVIVLAFLGVVIKMTFFVEEPDSLPWGEIIAGFVPDLSLLSEPSEKYAPFLAATGEYAEFWKGKIVAMQRDVMVSAAATAVGINMTFFMPFVLLRRRWGREHRGLAKFDLWTALLVPYVVATSCVIIAAGSQFHLQPVSPEEIAHDKEHLEGKLEKGLLGLINTRLAEEHEGYAEKSDAEKEELEKLHPLPDADKDMAAMLVKRDAFNLAASLENLTGKTFSHWVFGIGVVGMAFSTIIILMTINGHVVCEVIGVPHKGKPFVLGSLIAGLGVLGPFFWKDAAFWLVVPTSVFGFTLIPVAYLSFFLLMNSRKILGRERPQGGSRLIWNAAMLFALAIMGSAAVTVAWNKKWGDVSFGKYALIIYGILLVIGHFHLKTTRLEKKVAAMDNRLRRQSGGRGKKGEEGRRGGGREQQGRQDKQGGNRGRRRRRGGRSGGKPGEGSDQS